MKPIHKRIYTVLPRPVPSPSCPSTPSNLPRVRSNSASSVRSLYTISSSSSPLSFFDAPPQPAPSSRPSNSNLVASTRLAAEAKAELEGQTDSPNVGQNTGQPHASPGGPPPYSLALSTGHAESVSHTTAPNLKPFFPYSSFSSSFYHGPSPQDDAKADRGSKRQRVRYHLDIGAYGIPKRSRGACMAGCDGRAKLGLDDALQRQRDHAKSLNRAVQVGEDAYFVHGNAMGVADGVGGWSRVHPKAHAGENEPSPSALFARRLMHYCSEEVEAAGAESARDHDLPFAGLDSTDLYEELQDSLEELEDGLDVMMILEKAYEKTMRSHVCTESATPESEIDGLDTPSLGASTISPSQGASSTRSSAPSMSSPPSLPAPQHIPLAEGSSTALLAILEHPSSKSGLHGSTPHLFHPIARHICGDTGISDRGAIIKIAHLGDCVGMLIRGDEIIWRTEEMWWNFNTPVQLGPASPTRPRDARVFTVPVQADDILILASDGLSDNLWDEDVLDEVVRFRRPFQGAVQRAMLPSMLSEALCSRARRVAERRKSRQNESELEEDEVPFARRAREHGKTFRGGKPDDISVLVAIVSPVESS
ncbi:uncharacterized protein LAESUDRAFT_763533 [Laetiporus sulphureus 93-53]|uniref:Protein phosphatase n=1 Tax=Laetiporus sulphureus 93-53 TaxID=1314785 RepID=A0A165BUC9_9APHY|nr:uncharacterized protein LAESUDRAFT_763533 [Laetiporus sulphureus 93-53]KZT01666.1 hypothetical protein LAESUDRAFT_763533 [Laetiporus sulphureus 93-53]